MKSPKTVILAVFLFLALPLSAKSGVWIGVDAVGSGVVADVSGNVCAQIEIGARMDMGAVIDEEYGFYGTASVSVRTFAKQYSRFVEVPSYLQFSLGGGGFYMFDSFSLAGDAALVAVKVGDGWEIGAEARVCPRFMFGSLDVIRYSIGFPVVFTYTGNTVRCGLGVALRMEIY